MRWVATIEDVELLRRYTQTGCEAAFARLVQRRIALVILCRTAAHVGRALAMDATQMVFASLVAILANVSSDYREGKAATDRTLDWTAADVQARGVLLAEQWEFFRTVDPKTSHGGRFRGGYAQQLIERISRAEQEREKGETVVTAPNR